MNGICKIHNIEPEEELYQAIETNIKESFPHDIEVGYLEMY